MSLFLLDFKRQIDYWGVLVPTHHEGPLVFYSRFSIWSYRIDRLVFVNTPPYFLNGGILVKLVCLHGKAATPPSKTSTEVHIQKLFNASILTNSRWKFFLGICQIALPVLQRPITLINKFAYPLTFPKSPQTLFKVISDIKIFSQLNTFLVIMHPLRTQSLALDSRLWSSYVLSTLLPTLIFCALEWQVWLQ